MSNTVLQSLKATPRKVREYASDCMEAGLVPFIQSSPGMGKSSIVKTLGIDYNLELIDHRLSTSAPEDLTGLPTFIDEPVYNDKGVLTGTTKLATFAPFDLFPIRGRSIPKGKDGWLVFLDEFNSANKSVQAAAYKLILDRQVGSHHLHSNVALMAAGNLSTDRAIVNPLSTAMQSRVVHIEMELSFREWLEDVAYTYDWDHRIIAYLNFKPDNLMDFRPDHNNKTFCCPRTWEFMNKLIKGKEVKESKAPLYAGTITSGIATEFIQFTKVYANIPSIGDILAMPNEIPVPAESGTRFAVVSSLMSHVKEDTFDSIARYVNRFPTEFRIFFFRGMNVKQPNLRIHPVFQEAMIALSRYLHD